jgi:thiosulfate/3-mercaptopyruvate sulfurtransferase
VPTIACGSGILSDVTALFLILAWPAIAAEAPPVRSGLLVSTEWVSRHLDDPGVIILHVARDRKHYDAGHIPGARFVSFSELATNRDGRTNELPPLPDLIRLFEGAGVSNDTRVLLYSDSGGLGATRAYFTLDYLGHGDQTALIDGGIEKWRAEGRPVSTGEPPARAGRFLPRLRPEIVVTLDRMRDLSAAASMPESGVVVIDSRPDADRARSGGIPGSKNVHWRDTLVGADNPVLRPAAELRRIYEAAGMAPGRTAVTYCNSGVQATHSYFTLKYLGYDARMYDGSFSEWSKAEGAPVSGAQSR